MALARLFVLINFVALSICAPPPAKPPTATIDSGPIIGTATHVAKAASATVVNKFLGIPFAASPTRFAPPATATPWQKPFNATNYGKTCNQQFNYPEAAREVQIAFFDTPGPPAGEGEDCLNLNIFVPATQTTNKTVMVWIYGGGLTFGSNALPTYDGTSFAANQDVILVAINYRTNVFGFPGAPGLPLNATNLGFLDQRFALHWVQRNIHAFGGDPSKVLIFGESAGAASVDTLVLSQPHNPPFRAAISESGVSELYTSINSHTSPQAWNALGKGLNCTGSDTLACVRAANASTITTVIEHNAIDFTPVIDNYTLYAHPETLRASGKIARVPMMTGNNANEGRIFVIGDTNTTAYLETTFHLTAAQAAGLESLYPIPSLYINNSYTQIAQIFTDFTFQCPAATAFNNTHKAGIPAFRYIYNASFPNLEPVQGLGAYHSAEISIVFGTYPRTGATAEQAALSKYMQTSWATFAKQPMQGPGWGTWPNVGILGPVPGKNGMGVSYDVKVNGPLGRALDARCQAYQPIYKLLGVY